MRVTLEDSSGAFTFNDVLRIHVPPPTY